MYALIPCPEGISKDIKSSLRAADMYEGFWLVSQDPSLISQAGENVICAATKEGLADIVDRKFGLPYGYSRLSLHDHTSMYHWENSNYNHGDEPAIAKAKREFVAKCFKNGDRNWLIYALLPTPRVVDTKLHELDILAESKCHPKGIYTNRFKLQGDHKTDVVKEDFVVEDSPLGTRVMYNPKRAKRLAAIRRRHCSVGQRKPKRTCYHLLNLMVRALRETIDCQTITNLYREWRSSQGIHNTSGGVVNFFDMAKRMGKLATARKKIKPLLKELWVHKNLIQHNCSAEFRIWYAKEIEIAGGTPKDTERYITRVKSENIQKDSEKT